MNKCPKDVLSLIFKKLSNHRDISSLAFTSKRLLRFSGFYLSELHPNYKRNEVREGVTYRQAVGWVRLYRCRAIKSPIQSPSPSSQKNPLDEISYCNVSKNRNMVVWRKKSSKDKRIIRGNYKRSGAMLPGQDCELHKRNRGCILCI